jgi:hypothetical protein
MYVETRAEGDYGLESATGIGRGERAEKRMRKVEEGGALQTWQPGTTGNMHDNSNIDSHLKRPIDKVMQAGSWAVRMGVFSRGWMDMLILAGGMSYHSGLTGKISKVITECRSEIAKERNERAGARERKSGQKKERC